MRVLLIGGTGMTGPFIVRSLLASGHDVWLLHRSSDKPSACEGAIHLQADKAYLPAWRERIAALRLDVVVHMMAFNEADATTFIDTIAGIVPRAVVISSCDVYRAYGRLWRTEPGPPDPTPLSEDDPLRASLSIHGEGYDKTAVERISQSRPELPCTILRYPAVYGPGDGQHRLHAWVRRIDDGRPFLLMGQNQSSWRFTHGYVENVAAAAVLAITKPEAAGRIYNVGEMHTPTRAEWAQHVGLALGWNGRIELVPDENLPPHLCHDLDYRQDLTFTTSRIQNELGYADIVSPDEALQRTIAWERNHPGPHDPKHFDYASEDSLRDSFTKRVSF